MGGKELFWFGGALGFLLLVPGILGWGKEGHYAICKIAEVSISIINSYRLLIFLMLVDSGMYNVFEYFRIESTYKSSFGICQHVGYRL